MSFSHNPYLHAEIIYREEARDYEGWPGQSRHYEAGWAWYCHSCGGESKKAWDENTPFGVFMVEFRDHIANSHKRTPEDFEGWSVN
jgi:hypothetical protein